MLKKADLHVHICGCFHPEDLFLMARDVYREINWNRFGFLDRYEQIFGIRLDPVSMMERAVASGSIEEIRRVSLYPWQPQGNFEEFNITSYFPIAVTGYYLDKEDYHEILRPVVARHKQEGLAYVEYRNAFGAKGEELKLWHGRYARFFKEASDDIFTARYIIRLTGEPLETYQSIRELMTEQPDLIDTIVGLDFSGKELAPKSLVPFYRRLQDDNLKDPASALDLVVHIGENFFDISLESAIRRCHQSALFGARRLAHCIVLGMSPEAMAARRPDAHQVETVEERLDQIEYDLEHAQSLQRFGVYVDKEQLFIDRQALAEMSPAAQISGVYTEERLKGISGRQDYCLAELARMGTVIETCPTSNLCIGGVPDISSHPFPKLFRSAVPLAVCTDDPGIFGITLASEVDNVSKWFGISPAMLEERLGDPFGYRLGSRAKYK